MSSPKIYRPTPRRPFVAAPSTEQSTASLSSLSHPDESLSRTHSIRNLTSSTLLGIYSSTYDNTIDTQPSTPWGLGTEVSRQLSIPSGQMRRRSSVPPPKPLSTTTVFLATATRSVLLAGTGMGYGVLVRHLHDDRKLAPFQVEGFIKPGHDWRYLLFWGIAGVALGSLMPWVDTLFSADAERYAAMDAWGSSPVKHEEGEEEAGFLAADWTPVIRSIGAFVGIAFAIRKLPWASTLQVSLTLALVNPVLWYLIDRSKPGFLLSSAVGATGTALLLASNPDMLPAPTPTSSSRSVNGTLRHVDMLDHSTAGWVNRDRLEGGIWILSVLFCSCVCFGNIGRRLALNGGKRVKIDAR